MKMNDKEVLIDDVQREEITYECDGGIEIVINEALINNELLSLFRKGGEVKKVIQEFQMICFDREEYVRWEYDDMKIWQMFIVSQQDESSGISLLMRNH